MRRIHVVAFKMAPKYQGTGPGIYTVTDPPKGTGPGVYMVTDPPKGTGPGVYTVTDPPKGTGPGVYTVTDPFGTETVPKTGPAFLEVQFSDLIGNGLTVWLAGSV